MIENWNTKIYNMHKNLYKFVKKRNKCNMTIKSIITKGTISKKKSIKKRRKIIIIIILIKKKTHSHTQACIPFYFLGSRPIKLARVSKFQKFGQTVLQLHIYIYIYIDRFILFLPLA